MEYLVSTGDTTTSKVHKPSEENPHRPACKVEGRGNYRPVDETLAKRILGFEPSEELEEEEWKCTQCYFLDRIERGKAGDTITCPFCDTDVPRGGYPAHLTSHNGEAAHE